MATSVRLYCSPSIEPLPFQFVRYMGGSAFPASDAGKCRGYWWKGDLLVSKSTHHAFFHFGSIGVFKISSVISQSYCMGPRTGL